MKKSTILIKTPAISFTNNEVALLKKLISKKYPSSLCSVVDHLRSLMKKLQALTDNNLWYTASLYYPDDKDRYKVMEGLYSDDGNISINIRPIDIDQRESIKELKHSKDQIINNEIPNDIDNLYAILKLDNQYTVQVDGVKIDPFNLLCELKTFFTSTLEDIIYIHFNTYIDSDTVSLDISFIQKDCISHSIDIIIKFNK